MINLRKNIIKFYSKPSLMHEKCKLAFENIFVSRQGIFFSKIQILIKCVKIKLRSTMKKYAVDSAIHFLTKASLRPTVFTETTRQRWSKARNISSSSFGVIFILRT